jgi:hypothetical protein
VFFFFLIVPEPSFWQLFWERYKITHRIESESKRHRRRRQRQTQISILEKMKILHLSCLVRCSHFQSRHRSRSLRTLSIQIYARNVAASCSTLCLSRKIHSRRIRFLLIFWRIWSFESQMIQFAYWKWFSKSETRSRKWIKSTMNNVIWSMNFKTKEKFYEKE